MIMTFPSRLSLVTLGVADVDAAARFYERLGWKRSSASQNAVVFFDLGGIVLSLFGRNDLAADAGMPQVRPATASSRSVSMWEARGRSIPPSPRRREPAQAS
jgi:catechol 2,3-dioxygenase-like lactoylglutathione lyase family enzyme